jgi:hypothetical protein
VIQVLWQVMNVEVVARICESWHHHEIHGLLNEIIMNWPKIIQLAETLTFRNSKETKEHNTIMMCLLDIIVYVANREINRPVLIMSCSYRYRSFITTKNDWAKD